MHSRFLLCFSKVSGLLVMVMRLSVLFLCLGVNFGLLLVISRVKLIENLHR